MFSSCGGERPKVAQDSDLQTVGRGQPDRAASIGQEAETGDQEQERKLVAKVQRKLQLVSNFREQNVNHHLLRNRA